MLIGDISRHNGRRYPAKTAVISEGRQLTWGAVDERANRLATYLQSTGLTKGDRVAVCARNTLEWPEITYGLAKAGLVLVPVNIRLTPSEIQYIVEDSGCAAAIVHGDQAEIAAGPLAEAGIGTILQIGGTSLGKEYEEALAGGRNVDPTPADLTESDLHVLLYTSGTTGHPKGVMNDHRGMMAMTLDTTISTESRHEDIGLATTPFFTTGGVVRALTWLYLGQTIVIHPKFEPEALLDSIERDRITFTTFIPTMLIRTLRVLEEGRPYDLSSLRRISYGGAPISKEVIQEALVRLGCDMQQRYGLTEAGGQFTILTPQDHRDLLAGKEGIKSSCGRETPMAEVWIVDDDGNRLPAGETGEIVVRADSQARGYWNRPEQTAQTFRKDGVFSGDTGWLDAEGYLHIAGRKTDMIISGGFNIYPAELERVLGSHDLVDTVVVVGKAHPEWGETPVAVVVPRGDVDTAALEAELRELSRAELGGYKQPREYVFRSEVPLGPAGKVLKREVKASLADRPGQADGSGPALADQVADDLADRVVLVTGGGSGIGAACARLLASRGARVLIADVDEAAADKVAADLARGGGTDGAGRDSAAVAVRADVSDPADGDRMVAAALAAFGTLNGAVNCAGISSKLGLPLAQTPLETWRSIMSVNLDGVFYSLRAELPAIAAAGGGSIVNIASIMGIVGSSRSAAYTAAKHGVVGLTRAAALEYADAGIRVNAVAPGYVDTPFLSPESRRDSAGLAARHPLGRLASAEEIGQVVVFLLSGAASFVTGAVYTADGGYTAR